MSSFTFHLKPVVAQISLACALLSPALSSLSLAAEATQSGIDKHYHDDSVRPQDNFFRNTQGLWLKNVDIPATRSDWGTFAEAREDVQKQLATIIEAAAAEKKASSTETQQIAALYRSYSDLAFREQQGLKSLKTLLEQAQIKQPADLAKVFASYSRNHIPLPFAISVGQDKLNATQYLLNVYQSGLGLADRDYYIKLDEAKNAEIQQKYQQHMLTLMNLAGWQDVEKLQQSVLKIEKQIAQAQWSKVANRDTHKTYNRMTLAELQKLAPAFDWAAFFKANGIRHEDRINIAQPSFIQDLNAIISGSSAQDWQAYLQWRVLSHFAPYLGQKFADESFAFHGQYLSGTKEQKPLKLRAVEFVDNQLGEPLGKIYVKQYFPAEAKRRTEAMVQNFLQAFALSIDELDWMSPETKLQAQAKLKKISVKVGYPEIWTDYSQVKLQDRDVIANVLALRQFHFDKNMGKLGKTLDRSEWHMTPQTVNAYYSPTMNEIVFPAARLQSPLFNVNAEDAVNYGSLGISIGHEISHAFDDQGAKYDGDGNLRDWWTAEDKARFKAKTSILVQQYNAYSPVPGYFLNGELTLGENIADTAGLVMALKAYRLSLNGKPAPVIDGWTAEQRLFMGVAQARRFKAREQRAITLIKTDPHSPGEFRVNGSVRNHDEFYSAFGVKSGDQMYLAPEQRVKIW